MKCEWKTVKLGDIAEFNKFTYSVKDEWKFVNYLDTGNITENRIEAIQYIDLFKESLPSRAKRKVKNCNIIYSTVRPNQLHYGYIKEQPNNFLVSTGFAVIDVNEEFANSQFIYYFLTQNSITDYLHSIAEQSVSAYPSIKSSDLADVEINLPDLETQKKIAKILSSLDDKIELNNAINHNLQQQAQAVFKSWFIDFEPFGGKMPDDWKVESLLDIADYLNGLAMQKFRPENSDMGLPVLKIKELRQGFCDNDSERCSSQIHSQYVVNNGDVIFSWSGSLLVDFWCGGKCGLNQHLFKVTSNKFDKWFYYSWTMHHLQEFSAIAAGKATTMGHIKREDLGKAKVIVPSINDYEQIGKLLIPIYSQIISNRVENSKLSALRDTLLPKLMSGELDVSEVEI